MKSLYSVVLFIIALLNARPSIAQLTFTQVATGFVSPMEIASPPNASNRMFVVERNGTIRIFSGGAIRPDTFLNITPRVSTGGERGLLSMAFHPAYATNRYFFVLYVVANGDLTLARYQADAGNGNYADSANGVIILSIPHPTYDNHNGGKIAFGTDGKLYWGTGDGGSGNDPFNNAQNGHSLLGKMLRLDVDNFITPPYYTVPPDNPFVADTAVEDEVWNIGLRNPFRWSFDRLNGDFWIADVGQGTWEEVDHSPLAASSGLNYGWRCREGAHAYITGGCAASGFTDPVFEYSHSFGNSITGGYVYRGTTSPTLYGKYICSDFISGRSFVVTPGATAPYAFVMTAPLVSFITGFGEDQSGELFAVDISGNLYSVGGTFVPLPLSLLQFSAIKENQTAKLTWTASSDATVSKFSLERSVDGKSWKEITSLTAAENGGVTSYETYDQQPLAGDNLYRLRLLGNDGSFQYSSIEKVRFEKNTNVMIYPNPAKDMIYFELKDRELQGQYSITNMLGQRVKNNATIESQPQHEIDISLLPTGVYYLNITTGKHNAERFKFIKK